MTKKFKYFLFDWDGCIANTLPIWFGGMKAGLDYFKLAASDHIIKKGLQDWGVFPQLGVPDMAIFTEQVYGYVSKNLDSVCLNEGVVEILFKLRAEGIRFAIVTSTEKEKVFAVLERLNLVGLFECIIDRNDVEAVKPSPEPIEKALLLLDAEKHLTAMVGDSEADIEAGKNAGVSTIWFSSLENREYHIHIDPKELAPDITISGFRSLGDYF